MEAGGIGELVIGGVGTARYLDREKDAAKFTSLLALGWDRAYRSGDLVRADPEGLIFIGRADPGQDPRPPHRARRDRGRAAGCRRRGAAAAVSGPQRAEQLLVGYVVAEARPPTLRARAVLAEQLPAALVPLLAVVDALPTRTSGKVDRDALPWPPPARPTPRTPAPGRG